MSQPYITNVNVDVTVNTNINTPFKSILINVLINYLPKELINLIEEYSHLSRFNGTYNNLDSIYLCEIHLTRDGLMIVKRSNILIKSGISCHWVRQFFNGNNNELFIRYTKKIKLKRTQFGMIKYNISSQELKELSMNFWGEKGFYQDPNNKNKLFCDARDIYTYDQETDQFKGFYINYYFGESSLMTKRGLYMFNYGRDPNAPIFKSCIIDCKSLKIKDLNNLFINVQAAVSIDAEDRLLLLINRFGDVYQYDTLTEEVVKQSWKYHSSEQVRHHINGLVYKDGVLYSIIHPQGHSESTLYYLEEPFETNKWVGPIWLDCNLRIAL